MSGRWGLALAICILAAGCHKETPAAAQTKSPIQNSGPSDPAGRVEYLLDRADVELKHRHFQEALDLYTEVQRTSRDTGLVGRATYGTALVHLGRGDNRLALAALQSAIASAPPASRTDLRLLSSALHAELSEWKAAEEALEAVLSDPDAGPAARLQAYARLADVYEKRKRLPDLAAKLEARPKDREALSALGELYANRLGDPVRGLTTYEKLLALVPDDASVLQAIVDTAAKASKLDRAASATDELVKRASANPAAQVALLKHLGALCLRQKIWDQAVAALRSAEKIASTPAERDDVRLDLYGALKEEGKLPAEIESLEKSGDESALRGLLLIHQRITHATVRAEEALSKLMALRPDEPAYLVAEVDLARQKGENERAATAFEKLLPRDRKAALDLLESYFNALQILGKLDRGIEAMSRDAEQESPWRVLLLARTTAILAGLGKKAEAGRIADRLRTLLRESRRPADYLQAIETLGRSGLSADAWVLSEEALSLPLDAAARGNLLLARVELLEAQKKTDEAIKLCMEIARRLDVTDPARQAAERRRTELSPKK